jgi:hypothetical protein
MNPTSCLFGHGLHVLKPLSFLPYRAPKMREKHQLFFGLRLVSKEFQQPTIQTKPNQKEKHFGGFLNQIKVRQPIGRQDSMQTVIQTSRRLDSFCMERLRILNSFQIFKSEIKKSKTFPFKAYSMVPLSC